MVVTPKMCSIFFFLLSQPGRWLRFIYYLFTMPDEPAKRKEAAEKGRKWTRKSSSQTDEELHGPAMVGHYLWNKCLHFSIICLLI